MIPKFEVWLRGKLIGTFNDGVSAGICAGNINHTVHEAPYSDVYTNDKSESEKWTHFIFKGDL